MVIDTGPKKLAKSNALRSGRRRPFQKDLTGLALLEMSGDATQSGPSTLIHEQADSAVLV